MINELLRNNLPIFIVGVGLLFGGLTILISILIRVSRKNKIRRCSSSVNGVAYDVFLTGDGLSDRRVRFKYIVNGAEYGGLYPAYLQHGITLEKGQNVVLFFNPSDPSEYVFKELEEKTVKFQGVAGIVFGIAIIIICAIIAIII